MSAIVSHALGHSGNVGLAEGGHGRVLAQVECQVFFCVVKKLKRRK